MRFYIEAFDATHRQILGNLDGQAAIKARNYKRTNAYLFAVQAARTGKHVDKKIAYWRVIGEDGKTIEILERAALAQGGGSVNRFRVHIGYTPTGKSKWKRFMNLCDAREFCNRYHAKYGVILSIEKIKSAALAQGGEK